jgi:hypothetical protein
MNEEPNEVERAIAEQDDRIYRRSVETSARALLASLKYDLCNVLGVFTREEFAERATGNWHDNPDGEFYVWWLIDGRAYYRHHGRILVEREYGGRLEATYLDGTGKPIEPWHKETPLRPAFN